MGGGRRLNEGKNCKIKMPRNQFDIISISVSRLRKSKIKKNHKEIENKHNGIKIGEVYC